MLGVASFKLFCNVSEVLLVSEPGAQNSYGLLHYRGQCYCHG
ncbi:hypothetical protein EMIT0P294_20217 [Pseudomonas sp. IT-P294]